jgi:hypothetical protein
MRTLSIIVPASCIVVALACAEPLAPTPRSGSHDPALSASVSSGTTAFEGHGSSYQDCVGEVLQFNVHIPIRYRRVVSASGNILFVDPFIPQGAFGTATGQTSGTVWTLDRAVSPEVIHSNAAGESEFFTTNNWFVSESGSRLNFHNTGRFRQTADGEVVVDNLESICTLH